MNLGSHIAVAAVNSQDPAFWLGSALPDLAAMGRFRLLGSTVEPAVAEGISFHHATDQAFHGHPWFVGMQRRLHNTLTADGLARGPARAIAHVGPELLLDGAIPHKHLLNQSLATIEHLAPVLHSLVEPKHSSAWAEHLNLLQSRQPPEDNDDPEAVAARLNRMLSHRSRLAFPAAQINLVALRLAAAKPDIDQMGPSLVLELADHLGATPGS